MPRIATQSTTVDMSTTRVITTDSIRVDSVLVSLVSGGAQEVTIFFKTADESAIYFTLTCDIGGSVGFDVPWVADKGLALVKFTRGSGPGTHVTIVHSAIGV